MPQSAPARFVARLRRALGPAEDDARLVGRFVRSRDAAAFAELVRRHGPTVLAVCRRAAGDDHLADDAFQATFLVLARRAADVRPRAAVGAFLHGVAHRTALRARAMAARRRAREAPVSTLPEPAVPSTCPADAEALRALDEEIARLPEHLRAAVVLVELEGRPRREVAGQLGVPEGTLSSRLAKARKVLAGRLRRRGFALPAALLAAAAVPPGLARAAARLAGPGSVSPKVAALAAGVVRVMFLAKLKRVAAGAALALAAVALTAVSVWGPAPASPRPSLPRLAAAPAVRPRVGNILVWREGHAVLYRPDGTVERQWKGEQVPWAAFARLSPDGRTLAVLRRYEVRTFKTNVAVGGGASLPGTFKRNLCRLTLYPVDETLVGTDVELPGDSVESVVWSGDGARLYVGTHDDDDWDSRTKNLAYHVLDVRSRKATPLAVPAGHHLRDVSRDGKLLLTVGPVPRATDPRPVFLVPAGGRPARVDEVPGSPYQIQFSPDGKRLLFCGAGYKAAAAPALGGPAGPATGPPALARVEFWLDTVDLTSRARKPVVKLAVGRAAMQCRWSPDGRRVAHVECVTPITKPAGPEQAVIVCDADGRNPKEVLRITSWDLLSVDWR
jgi:RNA polymerase sigma factor (sigma-70 family)